MQHFSELVDEIAKADKVLIGIGEEFSLDKNEILENDEGYLFVKNLLKEDEVTASDVKILEDVLKKKYFSDDSNCENSSIYNAYKKLYNVIADKDYFVVTMNSDDLLEKSGFDGSKIVKPCGNWNMLQCATNCSNEVIDNTQIYKRLNIKIENKEKIQMPVCEKCGEKLVLNKVGVENYCENGYGSQWEKYMKWLSMTINRKICIIELGVGFKYPTVIRWPFEKTAYYNNKSTFIRINENFPQMTKELADKGISIEKNAIDFIYVSDEEKIMFT